MAAAPLSPPLFLLARFSRICYTVYVNYKSFTKGGLRMAFTEITPEEININPFTSWSKYVLVTAGNIEKCNTLLVTWGGFGVM